MCFHSEFFPLSQEGSWLLVSCDERLPALCRRKSQIPINHSENLDTGCPEVRTQMHKCMLAAASQGKFRKTGHALVLF